MRLLPHTRSCFVCGEANPAGLKLRMKTDGNRVITSWRPDQEHVGFQSTVHGGLISTVLDELMVWACAVATRRFAVCAEFTTRFRHPVRPGQDVTVEASLVRNLRGRILETEARMLSKEHDLLVTGTGRYMPIPAEQLPVLMSDVVGDLKEWIDGPG